MTTIPIGTIYGDHVSHFRPVLDVTFITAYIISYQLLKYGIETFYLNRPYNYSKDNLRDRIARNQVIDYIFKTITPCIYLPGHVCLYKRVYLAGAFRTFEFGFGTTP